MKSFKFGLFDFLVIIGGIGFARWIDGLLAQDKYNSVSSAG